MKREGKGLKWKSVQFGRHVFLDVLNILKPLSSETVFTFGKRKETLVRYKEIGVGGLSPQHRVRQKNLHYQRGLRKGIVVQQEPTALCSKFWPRPGNAFQRSSDKINVESTIDCLPVRYKFFMNHTLFVKKCNQHGYGDDSEVHCMLWRFVSGPYSITHDSSSVMMQSRKLGLSLEVWMRPWHDVDLRESVWDEHCANLLFRKS